MIKLKLLLFSIGLTSVCSFASKPYTCKVEIENQTSSEVEYSENYVTRKGQTTRKKASPPHRPFYYTLIESVIYEKSIRTFTRTGLYLDLEVKSSKRRRNSFAKIKLYRVVDQFFLASDDFYNTLLSIISNPYGLLQGEIRDPKRDYALVPNSTLSVQGKNSTSADIGNQYELKLECR